MRDHDDTRHWEAWTEAGHSGCGSWHRDENGPVVCACGATVIPVDWPCCLEGQRRPAANPVTLAVRSAIPGAEHVIAGARALYLSLDGTRYEYALPEEVSYLLGAYYDGEPLQPFSFALDLSAPVFSYRWRPRSRPVAATGRAAA